MHSESIYKGITGPAGPQEGRFSGAAYGGETSAQRAHFLGRLENALSRLDKAANRQVEIASSLTGGWPSNQAGDKAPQNAGVFGAVEDIATAIHRICDRIEEANQAVAERLP
ncbi:MULTISPECIES: hypothetical protein [unclassified Mesorhizobium]|uniref:hypothetical protein n=1 Tax=unclassified Mesorhizobium TaxID=325217 RepID=UPI000FD8FA21|nr:MULTISPECIES: hypothetical protein [unclassified Mesorhizobium]TGT76191.1 hypothetical protein EN809_000775 [Mesorhizobium sp. M2E.F.Ca.ET.166.01.1.1]TGW02306.1 hypothetical protein EN797_000775 [Mesorhizobium sp. M2E.F.Ca.ET.154.01.1.1]